jgi:hypothetical protein
MYYKKKCSLSSLSVLELINKSLDSLTQESRREVLEKSLKISLDFSEFVDFSLCRYLVRIRKRTTRQMRRFSVCGVFSNSYSVVMMLLNN